MKNKVWAVVYGAMLIGVWTPYNLFKILATIMLVLSILGCIIDDVGGKSK